MTTQTIENNRFPIRRIRFAVFSFFFLQGLCFSTWASRIPDIKSSLGMDDAAWGTMLLMIPIGQICGMTLSGILITRIGSKRILTVALISYAITLFLIGIVKSEYLLIATLIIYGFFGNFCNIAVNTQGVTLESQYNRPIMSSFHGGWSLASFTGAAIGLLMAVLRLPPSIHFTIIAVTICLGALFNFKYLQPDLQRDTKNSLSDTQQAKKNKPELFLILLGIVAFCGMAAEGAITDWNGVYLQDVVGVKKHLAPIGLTAYMITMATGRFFMDKAIQKWGRKRVLQYSGTMISLGLFLAVIYPNFIVTIIAFMIVGFGTSGVVPTLYSVAGQKTKISTGMALTIVSSISFMGFLLGPPLIGYISHATNLRYSYAVVAILGICIVWLSSRLKVLK